MTDATADPVCFLCGADRRPTPLVGRYRTEKLPAHGMCKACASATRHLTTMTPSALKVAHDEAVLRWTRVRYVLLRRVEP